MGADAAARLLADLRSMVDDPRVLAAMAATPRERFVSSAQRDRAYDNEPLPIGRGQTISQPLVVARMCALLDVRPGDRVLDVGTGSGWHAAILHALGGDVLSLERDRRLAAHARVLLRAAGVGDGVRVVVGDGYEGRPDDGPFQAINVAAAAPATALRTLEGQLADGGRLVAPLDTGDQVLVLIRRVGARLERYALEPVRFVPLVPGLTG